MEQLSSKHPAITLKQLTLIGVMTAVMCLLSPFSIPIPFSPVPITLATLGLYIIAYVLGTKLGTISCLIYLLLGAVGLPVFSSFSGGFAKIAGPTGGYLLGYLFLSAITGFFIERFSGKLVFAVIGMIVGTAICYAFGTLWLAAQMQLTFPQALATGVIPYLPGDAIKIIIACILGPKLRAAIQRIGN